MRKALLQYSTTACDFALQFLTIWYVTRLFDTEGWGLWSLGASISVVLYSATFVFDQFQVRHISNIWDEGDRKSAMWLQFRTSTIRAVNFIALFLFLLRFGPVIISALDLPKAVINLAIANLLTMAAYGMELPWSSPGLRALGLMGWRQVLLVGRLCCRISVFLWIDFANLTIANAAFAVAAIECGYTIITLLGSLFYFWRLPGKPKKIPIHFHEVLNLSLTQFFANIYNGGLGIVAGLILPLHELGMFNYARTMMSAANATVAAQVILVYRETLLKLKFQHRLEECRRRITGTSWLFVTASLTYILWAPAVLETLSLNAGEKFHTWLYVLAFSVIVYIRFSVNRERFVRYTIDDTRGPMRVMSIRIVSELSALLALTTTLTDRNVWVIFLVLWMFSGGHLFWLIYLSRRTPIKMTKRNGIVEFVAYFVLLLFAGTAAYLSINLIPDFRILLYGGLVLGAVSATVHVWTATRLIRYIDGKAGIA